MYFWRAESQVQLSPKFMVTKLRSTLSQSYSAKKHFKIKTNPKPTQNGATLAPKGPSVHRSGTNYKVLL